MVDFLSKPSQPDSDTTTATDTATATVPEKPDEARIPDEKNSDPATDPTPEQNPAHTETPSEEDLQKSIKHDGPEEEEEGECGFCLFMKGGGCKDAFTAWEKCVDEGEKNKEDIVNKCYQETTNLKKCMEAHPDYYAPLLQAEKAAEEEAAKQLEEEKEDSGSSDHNNLSSSG